jgi:predicted nucleic acid-binding protein
MKQSIWRKNLRDMTKSIHVNEYVIDTMGLVLRIENRKINSRLKSIFDSTEAGDTIIHIPSFVFAEILYLSEKRRIKALLSQVSEYLNEFLCYKEYPLSFDVIQASSQITDIPELHDRLIAGTARLLNQSLITNDPVIQASRFVKTFW